MTKLDLTCVTAEGTPREMGHSIGESLRTMIRGLIEHRLDVARSYLAERGHADHFERYQHSAQGGLSKLEVWDPEGFEELQSTAKGANVSPLDLYAVVNLTDVRDVACIGVPFPAEEGCTAFLSPSAHDRPLIAGQTWDLNAGDVEFVVGIHRLPRSGPETWSITVAGGPTLIGMNQHGLWVGTTTLKVRGAGPGVGYLDILHRAIREPNSQRAAQVVVSAPRAAAHSYWLADSTGGVTLECSRERAICRELGKRVLVQTNHCLDARHQADEPEVPSASSCRRLTRALDLLGDGVQSVDAARTILADRHDGDLSINRYPEDGEPTTTNACVVGIPAQRRVEACRGPADRGRWLQLTFDRSEG